MPLAYLFRAYFADGSIFDQTPEDRAVLDHPRKGVGSSFTDLLWLIEHEGKELTIFALRKPKARKPLVAVHLDTGHFEASGNEFYAGEDGLAPHIARRLIYYRLTRQHQSQVVNVRTGEALSEVQETSEVVYTIGWQATVGGRNVQHIIGLDG